VVTIVGEPEAQVFDPVNETLRLQRRKALTFELDAGKVIVMVKRETPSDPLLLMWNVLTVPLFTMVVKAIPVLVKLWVPVAKTTTLPETAVSVLFD
jgi:hypothetical protein